MKSIYRVNQFEDELSVFEQKGGQFCNPRVYKGWKARLLAFVIKRYCGRR